MSERFYTPGPLQPGPIYLDGPEAHHLVQVCRLRKGSQVILFNGDGREYPAHIVEADRKQVTLEVERIETPERELPFSMEIAVPLPKGDRIQFLVEKLTELGVARFVPLVTERAVIYPREAKRDKLERYVIEACKQCGRNRPMDIAELTTWTDYLHEKRGDEPRLLAHPGEPGLSLPPTWQSCRIILGPEGGLTAEEVQNARSAGWQPFGMGPTILRLETAAIVAAALARSAR